jgi:glutamate-ammonia-ligase adenylyltransferase
MALCRARPVFGSPGARAELQRIISEVLETPRDPDKLRTDVLSMRSEIAVHKAPAGPLDTKLLRGGLVDCEFIVHFLQLRERVAFNPRLGDAVDELIGAGLLPAAFAGHRALLGRLLVAARLLAPDCAHPGEGAQAVLAQAAGKPDYPALLQALAEARQGVAATWAEVFGEELEIDA